jgi:hypothetical protein
MKTKKRVPTFHIHVNCFSAEAPPLLISLGAKGELRVKKFSIERGLDGGETLWICTKKMTEERAALDWSTNIAARLEARCEARGYVECEAAYTHNITRYDLQPYKPTGDFPAGVWLPSEAPRMCDVHVFRPYQRSYDALDRRLLEHGFYAVADQDERIWTLLLGDQASGDALYPAFVEYFNAVQGITKIELEYVKMLSQFGGFQLPRVYSLTQEPFGGGHSKVATSSIVSS